MDVVTRVPPRALDYTHVGRLIYFDDTGAVHTDLRLWQRFVEDVKGDVDGFLAGEVAPLEDHRIENYVKACEKLTSSEPK